MRFDTAYFDAGIQRKNTGCEKWDDPGVLPEGGVPLWVADMDFPCPPAVEEAVKQRAAHPCFGYNNSQAEDRCTDALLSFWQRRHGLTLKRESCMTLPCVITGLKLCVRAFTAPGDRVAMFTPVYGPFYSAVKLNGRRVAAVPLAADAAGRYPMNLKGMEEALRGGAKMIMLCSPHNPLSRLWTGEELAALVKLAAAYKVPIVCDEIHADFVYAPGRFTPILSVEGAAERAVMLCAASKTFNVAGLQQAAAAALDETLIAALKKESDAAGVTSGNAFALAATEAAYRAGDAWLDGLIAYLDGNRRALREFAEEKLPRARLAPIEATYLAWMDLRAYGLTCEEMQKRCYRHGVAFTGGTFFGPEGEGFLRVNFGCPRRQLMEGMERLCAALKEE